MAKPAADDPQVFFLSEHMQIQGIEPQELADRLHLPYQTIWRYMNQQRRPRPENERKLEYALGLPTGALRRPPLEGEDALAGLSKRSREEAITYIRFLRQRDRAESE